MALYITEHCINCGACEPNCPNHAIYEPASSWSFADGMSRSHSPLSLDTFFIVPGKCTECAGFHESPQCISVCPVDCLVHSKTQELSFDSKQWLHA